jgi:hypothetical protein
MLELNQKTLKVLTRVFWVAVAVASAGWVGSIATTVIARREAVRTPEQGAPIAVPAESSP